MNKKQRKMQQLELGIEFWDDPQGPKDPANKYPRINPPSAQEPPEAILPAPKSPVNSSRYFNKENPDEKEEGNLPQH
jgi:hypothetical protein